MTHGLISSYKDGCRCDECREVAATKRREHREALRLVVTRDESWMLNAGCTAERRGDALADDWFDAPGTTGHARALDICLECPVIEACREYAGTHREMGLWGGVWRSEAKSKEAKRRTARALARAEDRKLRKDVEEYERLLASLEAECRA